MTTATTTMIPDELDIEDISDIRQISRPVLMAALFLAEDGDEIGARAVEFNAFDLGWDLGMTGMGSIWPDHQGIRFTHKELDTVVRLARYFVAREPAPATPASA